MESVKKQILRGIPSSDEEFLKIMESSILNSAIALELGEFDNEIEEEIMKHLVSLENGNILKNLLPVTLGNDGAVKNLRIKCACENIMTEETTFGHIREIFKSAHVKAISHCPQCHNWRMIDFRIKKYDNQYVMEYINKDGQWVRTQPSREGAISTVLNKIKKTLFKS